MTTNRVGSIDPAFKSRIHLSLYYPRLNRHTSIAIWKNHLLQIQKEMKEEKKKFEIDKRDIVTYARSHYKELETQGMPPWNGRQIRNAFQTAMALAEFHAKGSVPRLSSEQFKKVAATSREFENYLKNVWGGRNDAELARQDQIRIDEITAEQLRSGQFFIQQAPPQRLRRSSTANIFGGKKGSASGSSKRAPQRQDEVSESEHSSDDDDDLDTEDRTESEEDSEADNGVNDEDEEEEEDVEETLLTPPPETGRKSKKSKASKSSQDGVSTKKTSKASKK